MNYQQNLSSESDFFETISQPAHYTSGFPIGIIAIDLVYPKLPGNVVNASTYSFPVLYEKVNFEIEALFRGDKQIEEQIIHAAVKLEQQGVRAIIGACGFFAHFQKSVNAAVNVPVYLSSLCQLPLIKTGLKADQKIAVIAASGDSVTDRLLSNVGGKREECLVFDVGAMESFAPIRWGKTTLDNGKLTRDLMELAGNIRREHPEVGAILLECSDLPPYAWAIQKASGLPVYDFITLINWVEQAVVQKPYYGIF
jgi:hypothetical protein